MIKYNPFKNQGPFKTEKEVNEYLISKVNFYKTGFWIVVIFLVLSILMSYGSNKYNDLPNNCHIEPLYPSGEEVICD